jgi:hypothetical protein
MPRYNVAISFRAPDPPLIAFLSAHFELYFIPMWPGCTV